MKVIILTDSRGFGLKEFIDAKKPFPKGTLVHVISKGGATLAKLQQDLERSLRRSRETCDVIVLLAGICSFTARDKETQIIAYSTSKLQENTEFIESISAKYGSKLLLSTIPPVDINKYNNFGPQRSQELTEDIKLQQQNLERDISRYNTKIIDLSNALNTEAIKFHEHIRLNKIQGRGRRRRSSRKQPHASYNKLYDGVHPNPELKQKFFAHAVEVIQFHLICRKEPHSRLKVRVGDPSTSESGTEEEEKSWRHKRTKTV